MTVEKYEEYKRTASVHFMWHPLVLLTKIWINRNHELQFKPLVILLPIIGCCSFGNVISYTPSNFFACHRIMCMSPYVIFDVWGIPAWFFWQVCIIVELEPMQPEWKSEAPYACYRRLISSLRNLSIRIILNFKRPVLQMRVTLMINSYTYVDESMIIKIYASWHLCYQLLL